MESLRAVDRAVQAWLTPRRFAAIFGLAGACFLIAAVAAAVDRQQFLSTAVATEGTVVRFAASGRGGSNTQRYPVVEFATGSGETRQFTWRSGSEWDHTIGDRVAVRYDPADPRRAEVAGDAAAWVLPLGLAGAAAVFFAFAALVARVPGWSGPATGPRAPGRRRRQVDAGPAPPSPVVPSLPPERRPFARQRSDRAVAGLPAARGWRERGIGAIKVFGRSVLVLFIFSLAVAVTEQSEPLRQLNAAINRQPDLQQVAVPLLFSLAGLGALLLAVVPAFLAADGATNGDAGRRGSRYRQAGALAWRHWRGGASISAMKTAWRAGRWRREPEWRLIFSMLLGAALLFYGLAGAFAILSGPALVKLGAIVVLLYVTVRTAVAFARA